VLQPHYDDDDTRQDKHRVCANFKFNHLLLDDTRDVPSVADGYQFFGSRKFDVISKIDLKSAFTQMPLRRCDRILTAFTCNRRRLRHDTHTFGAKVLPGWFHKLIRELLQKEGCIDFTHSHLDDLLITSPASEHARHVNLVLAALTKYNLTVKLKKCYFGAQTLPVLGMILSADGVAPDTARISNMLFWTRPTSQKTLRHLLGLVNWFGVFSPNRSDLVAPFQTGLNSLRSSRDKLHWSPQLEDAFVALHENLLARVPFLHFPDPELALCLATDASKTAISAALFQRAPDGSIRYLGFASRTLRPSEKLYTIPT